MMNVALRALALAVNRPRREQHDVVHVLQVPVTQGLHYADFHEEVRGPSDMDILQRDDLGHFQWVL